MEDRFELVSRQTLTVPEELRHKGEFDFGTLGEAVVLRDTQTGVMYLWTKHGNTGGLTVLVDLYGNPMTCHSYKVNI